MNTRADSVQELMLSATELFHYSYKFRDSVVVICLQEVRDLFPLLPDLRVLQSSHIKAAIFVAATSEAHAEIARCNLKGQAFSVVESTDSQEDARLAVESWDSLGLPVFTVASADSIQELSNSALGFCDEVQAIKLFIVQESEGIFVNNVFLSHPTIPDLLESLDEGAECSTGSDLVRHLCAEQQKSGLDIALIQSKAGSLFQELFTHRGSGSLLTGSYPNLIRTATLDDVVEISLLLTPYIQAGSILPVSEDQIIESIAQYHVFTVNGEIVAAASIRDFGEASELGKFCTLPRYQRKGRARLLALSLIERAKELQKRYVFALSREPGMWNFFLNLGFEQCSYEDLPQDWQEQYDQSRGSHAFRLELEKHL